MIIKYNNQETIEAFLNLFSLGIDAKAVDIEEITYNTCTGDVQYKFVQPVEYLTQTIQLGKIIE